MFSISWESSVGQKRERCHHVNTCVWEGHHSIMRIGTIAMGDITSYGGEAQNVRDGTRNLRTHTHTHTCTHSNLPDSCERCPRAATSVCSALSYCLSLM